MKHMRAMIARGIDGGQRASPKEEKPKEGRGPLPSLNNEAMVTGTRREKGLGAELVGPAVRKRQTGAQ